MLYLHPYISREKKIQKKFVEYTDPMLKRDEKIEELIESENTTEA